MFKRNLEEFARKYRADIRRDPQFRAQFHAMCANIGVDPLASSKLACASARPCVCACVRENACVRACVCTCLCMVCGGWGGGRTEASAPSQHRRRPFGVQKGGMFF